MGLRKLPYWTRVALAEDEALLASWSGPVPGPVRMHCLLLREAVMSPAEVGRAAWHMCLNMWAPQVLGEYVDLKALDGGQ